jgi:hypothetical protein
MPFLWPARTMLFRIYVSPFAPNPLRRSHPRKRK